jgi:hypothetical protein
MATRAQPFVHLASHTEDTRTPLSREWPMRAPKPAVTAAWRPPHLTRAGAPADDVRTVAPGPR